VNFNIYNIEKMMNSLWLVKKNWKS